jgi:hypothetical protein
MVDPPPVEPMMRYSSVGKFSLLELEGLCGVAFSSTHVYKNDNELEIESTMEKTFGKSVHVDSNIESPSIKAELIVSSIVEGSKNLGREEVYADMFMFSPSIQLQGGRLSKNSTV